MKKGKFKFNPDTLSFDKVTTNAARKFWRGLNYFLFSLVISVAYYIVFSTFFDTPIERGIRRENEEMKEKLEQFNSRFENLTAVLKDIQQRDINIYRTIFESEPVHLSNPQFNEGGIDRYSYLEDLSNYDIVRESAKKIQNLSREVYIQTKSFDELVEVAKKKEEMVSRLPSIQPITNKDLRRVASPFGVRMHPFYKVLKMHTGMDFVAPTGTDIFATGNGIVSDVINSSRGYGNTIIIDHGFGYQTLYAHLSKIMVRPGQSVKRGDVIGIVGNTGMSVAPHLHYEIRKNDEPINPINFYYSELNPYSYAKIIELAAQSGQSLD